MAANDFPPFLSWSKDKRCIIAHSSICNPHQKKKKKKSCQMAANWVLRAPDRPLLSTIPPSLQRFNEGRFAAVAWAQAHLPDKYLSIKIRSGDWLRWFWLPKSREQIQTCFDHVVEVLFRAFVGLMHTQCHSFMTHHYQWVVNFPQSISLLTVFHNKGKC